MKCVDEMSVTELKAMRHDYLEQRIQIEGALQYLARIIAQRLRAEEQAADPSKVVAESDKA